MRNRLRITLTAGLLALVGTLCAAAPSGEASAAFETHDGYVCWLQLESASSETVRARIYSQPDCAGTYEGQFYLYSSDSGHIHAQYQRLFEGFLAAVTHDLRVRARVEALSLFGGTVRYLVYVRFYSD